MSGRVLTAQVDYRSAPVSLQTARALVDAKLRNCELLLTSYIRSRQRRSEPAAAWLRENQIRIAGLRWRLLGAERKKIFQVEALATKFYWEAVAYFCRQAAGWHRVYPHASDTLSILLNSGYVMLARQSREALTRAGLTTEIGVLHGDNSGRPLGYDFMEPFRQPLVDRLIIPYFSRRSRRKIERDDATFKKVLWRLANIYQESYQYHGRRERWERILYLEAVKLKQAIVVGEIWEPLFFRWGHRKNGQ